MRDYTNLQWPEAPFGAEQRPFGHHADMLAAFALDWTTPADGDPLPVAAAAVYLRVRRHGTACQVTEDTLSIATGPPSSSTAPNCPTCSRLPTGR